jgi:hypothetical protein
LTFGIDAKKTNPTPTIIQSDCESLWLIPSSLETPPNAPELICHRLLPVVLDMSSPR